MGYTYQQNHSSYPNSETNFQDFSRTQIDFSRALKFTLTPTLPRSLCQFSLLPSIHFLCFQLDLTDSQNFPGRVASFQDFPGLENSIKKFQDFPGFQGPGRTLKTYMYFNLQLIISAAVKKKLNKTTTKNKYTFFNFYLSFHGYSVTVRLH